MITLGIESTAHTFGVGILDSATVLANVRDLYTTEAGGIVPAKAAEHHMLVWRRVLDQALDEAGITMADVGIIAFSRAPGIGHTLRIGATIARSLAYHHRKPLIGVNHCIAHLEIGRALCDATDPVLLYASGANTQIIAFEAGRYRVFGETLDGGIGNFLDTFARELGLGFPGGPLVEKLALEGSNYVELPYVVKGMDTSFGGILTNLKQKWRSGKYTKEDLAFSLQETVFAMLIEASERAMAHTQKRELLLGGGVACNKRLQEMARIMCEQRSATSYVLENQFNVDNGAMIAHLGALMHQAGLRSDLFSTPIDPYERTDQVEVSWRD